MLRFPLLGGGGKGKQEVTLRTRVHMLKGVALHTSKGKGHGRCIQDAMNTRNPGCSTTRVWRCAHGHALIFV